MAPRDPGCPADTILVTLRCRRCRKTWKTRPEVARRISPRTFTCARVGEEAERACAERRTRRPGIVVWRR